uniref:Uncharacterized protein n=1 Tax=Anopheles atroparvus TaxID=41427 RepID=A0A182J7X0_ANOAO
MPRQKRSPRGCLDDSRQQSGVVVVQHDGGRSRMKQVGRSISRGGRSCRRLHGDPDVASRRLRGLRDLVLEHAVRLTAAARLILPEAWRRRARLFDLHVAHGAGLLVAERRRLVAVLAAGTLLTC